MPENLEVINRLLSPSVWQMADSQYVAMAIILDGIKRSAYLSSKVGHIFSVYLECGR